MAELILLLTFSSEAKPSFISSDVNIGNFKRFSHIWSNAWKSHTNLTHPGKYFRPSKVKIMRPTSPK